MSLVRRGGSSSGTSYFVVEGTTLYLIFNGSILASWTSSVPTGFLALEDGTGDILQETGSHIYAE